MVAIDGPLVGRLVTQLDEDLTRDGRLGMVRRYLRGEHNPPYMPRGAKQEYRELAKRAITNWLPLISDTYAKALAVDGYRRAKSADNATAWAIWQDNGLDARQSIAVRGALEYGASYALVLPGKPVPFFRPLSPLRTLAWYLDEDDDYPEVFLRSRGTSADGSRVAEIVTESAVYTYVRPKDETNWKRTAEAMHGLGVTPVVRFRERLSDESPGIIRPAFTLQDRINEIVFSALVALQYAAFRQRWATGMAIPEDDDGNPLEPFSAAVDRLWVAEDAEARFGDFSQTDIRGHLEFYLGTVRTLAAVSQISPSVLTGDLSNLSAEALATLYDSTTKKIAEYETNFGESWETGLRLASLAAGDRQGAQDTASQVRWRDTEARSLASTVDALGKVAQMLQVPVEALWEKIPGVTDTDVAYWKRLRSEQDVLGALVGDFQRQSATTPPAQAATATAAPAA